MAIILANNATAKLAGAITTSSTSLTVQTGHGALFPAPSSPDWFPVTLIDASGNIEICKCTARSGDILTIIRAQEGTSPKAFSDGARVSLRVTKAVLDYVFSVVNPLSGLTPSADKIQYYTSESDSALATFTDFARTLLDDTDASTALSTLGVSDFIKTLLDDANPATARETISAIAKGVAPADLNSISETGIYKITGVASHRPSGSNVTGDHVLHLDYDVSNAAQIYVPFSGNAFALRKKSSGAWGSWFYIYTTENKPSPSEIGAQDADATLTALAGLTTAADKIPYFTGTDTASVATLTSFSRTLLDDVDAATARQTLGAQASDATLTALAGVSTAADKIPYFTGTDTASVATLTSFSRTLLDDVDAAAARQTLGAQASDATLTALAGVSTAADKIPYFTGTDTASVATLTSFARTLLAATDQLSARQVLSAQTWDPTLTALAGVATGADKIPYFTGTDTASVTTLTALARNLIDSEDATDACYSLGVARTSDFKYSATGYIKIPRSGDGYLILQWGKSAAMAQNTTSSITFPTAFPQQCASVICSPTSTANTASMVAYPDAVTLTGFTIRGDTDNANSGVYWFAIGS